MSCTNCKRLCKRLIISDAVNFTDGTLIIDIPAGSYEDRNKYCIVVAQNLPDTTTINAPVLISIGGEATTYPLLNADCTTVYACSINRRTRYSVCVHTDVAGGAFKLLDKIPCSQCKNNVPALPVPAPAPTPVV